MIKLEPVVVYEDEKILVLDKPSGMIVNRADTSKDEFTLQDWINNRVILGNEVTPESDSGQARMTVMADFNKRSGIIHRLDKDTSGLLVIAKTEEAFINLQNQFKSREVHKKYLALVHGIVEPKNGTVNVPIERNPFNRKRFGVFLGGREAVTEYKTIKNYSLRHSGEDPPVGGDDSRIKNGFWTSQNDVTKEFTLLEVTPRTGRTHQIRVHLMHLGHPIVSDILYAGRKNIKADLKFCPRLFLHAESIEFMHPKTGKRVRFSSKLPEELKKVLNFLKN